MTILTFIRIVSQCIESTHWRVSRYGEINVSCPWLASSARNSGTEILDSSGLLDRYLNAFQGLRWYYLIVPKWKQLWLGGLIVWQFYKLSFTSTNCFLRISFLFKWKTTRLKRRTEVIFENSEGRLEEHVIPHGRLFFQVFMDIETF